MINNVKILPYNDIEGSKKVLDKFAKDVCCLIIEPISASLPLEKSKDYLKFLRKYCDKKKIILIFDEIVTGIRTDKGSVQNKFNIYPDITLAGKIIGGGLPMSLILTNRNISNKIDDLKKKIFFGGTFSGNSLSTYVSDEFLKFVIKNKKKIFKDLELKSLKFYSGLNYLIKQNNLNVSIVRFGSVLRIIFSKKIPRDRLQRDFLEKKNNSKRLKFIHFLNKKKIIFPLNGIIFLNTSFTIKEIDNIVEIIGSGLKKYFS